MITCPNPSCRRSNKDDATYCVYCGRRLRENVNSPAPSPEAGKMAGRGRNGLFVGLILVGVIAGMVAGLHKKEQGSMSYDEPIGFEYTDKVFDPGFEDHVTTGTIVLESSPKGARIRLDGHKTSTRTPAIFSGLAEGEHEVRVEYRRLGATYYFEDRIVVEAGTMITRRYEF